jgi:hypothetical protein
MSGPRGHRCPRCGCRVRPEEANCRGCGLLIHEADEVQAVLVSGPIEVAKPALPTAQQSGLEQAVRSWGAWAGGAVYLASAITIFWTFMSFFGNGPYLANRIQPAAFAALVGAAIPGGVVWLIVDSLQATWAWLWTPAPAPDGVDLRPRYGWLAGPARLLALLLPPLIGTLVGLAIHPADPAFSMLIGGLATGLPVGLLSAFGISVMLWNQ